MDKKQTLENIHKKWMKECKCELKNSCTQAVPGAGSPEAKIVFIGEAPGKSEDQKGIPFVGAAGKFLDEMLGIIKLERKDVYIANVVKCRPPENRDPLPEEAQACWPWLLEQVRIIDPKLVVTLGRHSMERFLPNMKISQMHGKALRRNIPGIGTKVFYALYHPAAALYNGSMRTVLIDDFKKIPKVLKAIKKSEEGSSAVKNDENKGEQNHLL